MALFEAAILKLQALGFFKFFLPFILTAAIFYGGLRRAKLFGEPETNVAVNAIVAFAISLFVWAAPIILGVDIETKLSAFFVQGFSVTLIVLIALVIAGMFFTPDLAKSMGEKFKGPTFWGAAIIVSLILGIVLLISSGLGSILFPGLGSDFGDVFSSNTFISIVIILLVIGSIFMVVRSGESEKK